MASAQAIRSSEGAAPSRLEVYAGYGYWNPLTSNINGYRYDTLSDPNAAANFTFFFTQHLGVRVDGNYFHDHRSAATGAATVCSYDATLKLRCLNDQSVATGAVGPVYRMQFGRFVPFVHVLGGAIRLNGPVANPLQWGWMADGGVGVDYVLPFFHDHLAVRPIQADYEYGHVKYGPLVLPAGIEGGATDIGAVHLSAGVVFRFGEVVHEAVDLACSADPALVYPGEPVMATAMARGFGKNPHLYYTWQLPAGMKAMQDSAVRIDTAALAPGDYKATVEVRERAKGKARATCSAGFTVHAYEPPTLSCSASPSSVLSGQTAVITSVGRSPQNLALSYTYASSAGTISGGGSSAELNTAGVAPGSLITVNCGVTDDHGKTATAQTSVTVSAPLPVAAAPMSQTALPEVAKEEPLCTILFERDRKRPVRVDNEAKACLDSVALSKGREVLSKLVLVGTYVTGESANTGAERALHAKQYLVDEKGIDPNAIQTMVRAGEQRSVESVLLPGDAVFEDNGAMEFDPASVRLHGEAYGKRHRTR